MQETPAKFDEFVIAAKAKGASDEFLLSLLTHRGWPEGEVLASLGGYWEGISGVTIPERPGLGEASRDAFLYLLSFSTLATWASALGSLLFRLIDYWLPDPVVAQLFNFRATITWQMASIAVAFPIFLLVMRTIIAEGQASPERFQSGVRKWLTYIALLLTAGGMICDLIFFLDYFLTGELTTRFLWKVLTVLVICAAIFSYYLGSLRWGKAISSGSPKRLSLYFGVAAIMVVAITFCIGLGLAGTPSRQRSLEADKRRVQDLRAIAQAIHAWNTRAEPSANSLPPSLRALVGNGVNPSQTVDPETKTAYEYRSLSPGRYEVCATFSAATEEDQLPNTQTWSHGRGRKCFNLDASLQPAW